MATTTAARKEDKMIPRTGADNNTGNSIDPGYFVNMGEFMEALHNVRKDINWDSLNDENKARIRQQAREDIMRRLDTMERRQYRLAEQMRATINTVNRANNTILADLVAIQRIKTDLLKTYE